MTDLTWSILVDWDGNGTAETEEASRTFGLLIERGRENMMTPEGEFADPRVGKATLWFWNEDRRFDPYYVDSPLYPNVLPGRKVQINVDYGSGAGGLAYWQNNYWPGNYWAADELVGGYWQEAGRAQYPVFEGHIDDMQPRYRDGKRVVRMVILDGWRGLRDETIYLPVDTDVLTGEAISAILSDVGWPELDKYVTLNGDTIPYWWQTGETAARAIMDLVHSNMGKVWISAGGEFHWIERADLYNDAVDMTITDGELRKEIIVPFQWNLIRNQIRVEVHPRTEVTAIELTRMYDKPLIQPGESQTYWLDYVYNNREVVATLLTTPAATTDYTMNSLADGTGTNLTANFSVTHTALGTVGKVVVTNNGATAGYVTLLKMRGNALDEPMKATVERPDTTSQGVYGVRTLKIDQPWVQTIALAKELAGYLSGLLSNPLTEPVIEMEGYPNTQYAYDLYTRVALDAASVGISSTEFYIGYISHEWLTDNGQRVLTRWNLEPINSTAYWKFSTRIGTLSRFGF